MPPTLPVTLDLNPTMGATFVGVIVAAILYGITLLQTVYYYSNFPNDDLVLKVTVGVLAILDTATLMINCHAVYWYTIKNWGNLLVVNKIVWSLVAHVYFTNTIALIVQIYLIKRIYILSSRKLIIPIFLALLALLSFGSGIAYGVKLGQLGLQTLIPRILYLIRTSLATTLVVDVLITIALSWYLHRSRTGMRSTDSLINFLIVYTVNTGLMTSLCALMDVVLHSALGGTLAYLTFYVMLSKLYTNSFLGTLNARQILRSRTAVVRSLHSSGSGGTTAAGVPRSKDTSDGDTELDSMQFKPTFPPSDPVYA